MKKTRRIFSVICAIALLLGSATTAFAGELMVIAPEDTFGCSRTERDAEVLRALWQAGYFAGRKVSESVRSFWSE